MIRIEREHLAKIHNMTTPGAISYLNDIISGQVNDLKQKGVLKIDCERHYPQDRAKDNTYQAICGGCGEKIFPESWITITGVPR